jgi:hypothetical protein
MAERLPAHIEAAAIVRRVGAEGGFAAVLNKGDPDRGALVLVLRRRGEFSGLLEREMGPDFRYRWVLSRSAADLDEQKLDELIRRKLRFDADSWLIELDVAEPERFIAETTSAG